MKLLELKRKLGKANISPLTYSLEGGYPSEQYCIEENYGKWSVYYCERGIRRDEKLFYNEDEACQYLYDLLISDPTTRVK